MEAAEILQADYLDLLFHERNKAYGGYALRRHYQNRALGAFGIMLSLLLTVAAVLHISGRSGQARDEAGTLFHKDDIVMTEVVIPDPPAPKPEPAGKAAIAETIRHTVPVIAPDQTVKPEDVLPETALAESGLSGPVTAEGSPDGILVAHSTDKPGNGLSGSGDVTGAGSGVVTGSREEVRQWADQMPEFPGGVAALADFIRRNLRYPAAALEAGIAGRVVVRFVVNTSGAVENAQILRGIGGGCDAEALRVVKSMPAWKPGKQNGHAVKVYFTLPVTFMLM